jgi:hypothetical protein
MKFLTNSSGNPKRLFVPINEFEFNSFTVRVQRLAFRPSKAPGGVFRITQRNGKSLWATSPIPAAV